MAQRADVFDLGQLRLTTGEGRRIADLEVRLDDLEFGGQSYSVPGRIGVLLDISCMTGGGYALRLRFEAAIVGPCMRCLGGASRILEVDSREVDQPGGEGELSSPYVGDEELDLHAWARDAYLLALPAQVLCRDDCAGLCPECGADLNAEPGHTHGGGPDPRWDALRELKLD